MELLITLGLPATGFREDVSVELDPFVPVDELRDALAEWARRGVEVPSDPLLVVVKSGGECRRLDPFVSVFDSGLVSGGTVQLVETTTFHRLDGAGGSMDPERPTMALDITSGPEAGRTVLLPIGRQLVGRACDAAVQVHDPAISRHHFTVDVSSDLKVTIEPDPEASNPTLVAAEELNGPRVLEPEEAVFAGTTQFVLRGAIVERTGHRDRLGQVAFNPLPYRRPVVRPRKLDELERPPDRPGRRRLSPILVLVPLAASALIVVVTGQIVFLVMAGLSPLMMVSNHFSEGRLSQANYRREGSEFRKRVSNRSTEVTVALEAERRERLTAAPDVPFLSRQAAGRLGRLWERPRGSPDFLQLRLGLGTVPSQIETPIAPGGDPDLRKDAAIELEHHAQQELVPVTLPLRRRTGGGRLRAARQSDSAGPVPGPPGSSPAQPGAARRGRGRAFGPPGRVVLAEVVTALPFGHLPARGPPPRRRACGRWPDRPAGASRGGAQWARPVRVGAVAPPSGRYPRALRAQPRRARFPARFQ